MTMNAEMITKKLPQNIQVLIDNPLLNADKWSEEWDKWAKEILCMLCKKKDKGTISVEERRFLHKVYLKNIGVLDAAGNDAFLNFYMGV